MKVLMFVLTGLVSWQAHALQVTVTIPPLAAMVKPYLSGDDTLTVLLSPGASPHGFQFRPSHLTALNEADLILTVGSGVDRWADKPIRQIMAEKETSSGETLPVWVVMQKQPGLVVLPKRATTGSAHSASHDHEHHEDEAETETSGESVAPLKMDGHTWLSVHNAGLMIEAIGVAMASLKPEATEQIRAQQQANLADIMAADQTIRAQLEPVEEVPYLVLHDAFQYFEKRYHLNNQGAIQVSAEVKPSVKRVLMLRQRIEQDGIRCVFKEPQFSDKQLRYITRGLDVKIGELDPLGRNQSHQSYPEFIQGLAAQYRACLE
ncbi:hypothetical protein AVO42_04895 [Thiomicrospira sp. XS5]|uniref:zinc ABC transporter substrate-binding protein n=1 Tax=Thiomicrospira sp. XS5 TaxID=1775636 RepID=UPI000748EB5D|nr:zinc ABC transporter substrate-binding protein [Thiomicrospira sp. XS5]KUJ74730.1 hypothetical protein AVO42_04895 [Thiomicrospira sp. XS5]